MARGFEPETGLLNCDDHAEPRAEEDSADGVAETQEPTAAVPYRPLSSTVRMAALVVCLAGLATLAIPGGMFGDAPHYQLSREQARAAADAFVRTRGLDPAAFQNVTYPAAHWDDDDALAGKYFLERQSCSAAKALFDRNRPLHVWMARYFKSLDQEEITVAVHPETGKVTGFGHTIPETRPGADLTPERARVIAEQFAAPWGWDTGAMDLKESDSEKKKARRDYSFEWEARPGDARNVDETRWRVEINVSGDRVTSARGFWKLPEGWQRAREQQNALAITLSLLKIATLACLIVYALYLLIRGTRYGMVRWRAAVRLAVPATILFPIAPLLSAGLMLRNYRTDIPLETFRAMSYLSVAMSAVFGFLLMGAAAALIVTFYPEAIPSLRRGIRRVMAVDAVVALLAAVGMAAALTRIQAMAEAWFHEFAIVSVGNPEIIASAAPAVAAVAGAVRGMVTDAALLGLIALMAWQIEKPWMRVAGVLLALCASIPNQVRTPGGSLLHYALALVMAAAGIAFCRYFAGRNYLTYALLLWLMALRTPMLQMADTGNAALMAQAWLVAGVMAAGVIWGIAPLFTRARAESEPRP